MKKVALASCYFKHNYGSALQAYALQEALFKHGVECENIDVSHLKDFSVGKKRYYKQNAFNLKLVSAKLGMVKLAVRKKLFKDKLSKNLRIRDGAFNRFKTEFILSKKYASYKELNAECTQRYSDVIVGSDQLWLPVNVVADYYTLSFVPDGINKISYSTSIGVSQIPDRYKPDYKEFLSRINHLSVREQKAADIIGDLGIKAECVCDPTMLLTGEEWIERAKKAKKPSGEYIFCYFLGKNKWQRKWVKNLSVLTGLKIVSVNNCDERDKYGDKIADKLPYDVNPFDWINLIYGAKYVCTDSFHGTVFSILLGKRFFTFSRFKEKSAMSTNSRIRDLLGKFKLSDRWIGKEISPDKALDMPIDYAGVNAILSEYRKQSEGFLLSSLTYKKEKPVTVADLARYECCGCTACKSACPKDAIAMRADAEGFLYPSVDIDKCVSCGLCVKTCAVYNSKPIAEKPQRAYLVQHKDEKILKESTSGGAFTAIAEAVLDEGGVIFGAAFDESFVVRHIAVEGKTDLYKFRNSKYVQSDLGDSYSAVKKYLSSGRRVLFSGTPCQVEGLVCFLHNKCDNLTLVDISCRAVPSPKVWEKYKEFKTCGGNVEKAVFRDKEKFGYQYSQMKLKISGKEQNGGVDSDPYLRAFFHDLSDRPSCYECAFKKRYRVSDLTIWDCFDVYRLDKSFDDNRGVTRILTQSARGEEIVAKLKSCRVKEIPAEKAVEKVNELVSSVPSNPARAQFFKDLNEMEAGAFFKKWFPDSFKVKTERFIRHSTERLGIYRPLKRLARKILGKE